MKSFTSRVYFILLTISEKADNDTFHPGLFMEFFKHRNFNQITFIFEHTEDAGSNLPLLR